jgi:hypothetical protein
MQRHVTIVFVVIVKEGELLTPIGGILCVVEIKHNELGGRVVGLDEFVGKHLSEAIKSGVGDGIFESADGWLTGEGMSLLRMSPGKHL